MSINSKRSRGKIFTRKRIKIASIVILLLLVSGFGAFSYYIGVNVADGLTYVNRGKDTKSSSVKQLEIWGYDAKAFEAKFKAENITLTAADGNRVPVAYYSVSGNMDNNTVVIVHGLGGDHVSAYPQAEIYLNNGWNVLALDQRGNGDSTNEKVSFGYYEKLDVMAVVDYASEVTADKKIVVHGISMGGATAGLYGGTDHANNNVDAIILDSAFDNMKNMFFLKWEDMDSGLPGEYVAWCGDIALKIKYGYNFKDADVVEALKTCDIPTLVIQGEQDDVATVEMGEKIFKSIASVKKEYWLTDSKHIEASIDYPVQYKERIISFID